MTTSITTMFEKIKNKYGEVGSWAIWKSPAEDDLTLTSNMDVDDIFDLDKNPKILKQLRNNVIMVGENFSRPTGDFPKFHNFHTFIGDNINHTTLRNASKLRYAFKETPYWGAYMTDIKKNHVESKSENVKHNDDLIENFRIFREELASLQANKPVIIAFGNKVYSLLKKHLKQEEYSRLVGVTHYSYRNEGCGKHEGYKKRVLKQLSEI